MTQIRTTVVSYKDFTSMDFVPPATYFIQNALGDYVFMHTWDRAKAQDFVDEEYGKGKYKVKASKMPTSRRKQDSEGNAIPFAGEYTATGHNSRKGFAQHLKKTQ